MHEDQSCLVGRRVPLLVVVTMKFSGGITVFLFLFCRIECKFVVPEVIIEPLSPNGLRVSIPDSPGVQNFAFHANINKQINGKEEGEISGSVRKPDNGRWMIYFRDTVLERGDVLYYWVWVQHNRLGFDKERQEFEVKELIDKDAVAACLPSKTTINNKVATCGKRLIFEDNFDHFNVLKWTREYYIPRGPDYEFCSYESDADHLVIKDGFAIMKASVRENPYEGKIDMDRECTATRNNKKVQDCQASVSRSILPPIKSAQMTSKFAFRYGKVEVMAQLPRGDWIYPQLYLEPQNYEYGDQKYESGRVIIACARGNAGLNSGTGDIGNYLLYFGPVLGAYDPTRSTVLKKMPGQTWSSEAHNFTLVWLPEKFIFYVDGSQGQDILPPGGQFSSLQSSLGLKHATSWKTPLAPFDKEFVLRFGVGVGGIVEFPDGSFSNGREKPWKNTSPKASLHFYENKDAWMPTWTDGTLKIKSVKVWSL